MRPVSCIRRPSAQAILTRRIDSINSTESPITYRVSSQVQWAAGWANYSSQFAVSPTDDWGIAGVIGQPNSTMFGDSREAWSPATIDGNCVNDAETEDHYYTEFFEAVFATPMYLNQIIVHENFGPGLITRILVPSDRNPTQWKSIFERDPHETLWNFAETYTYFMPKMCATMWPVDRVRIEVDTCHRTGWYEVNAVRAQGGVLDLGNVLNATDKLYISATPGFTGNFTFGLTATHCFGVFDATSPPYTTHVRVLDPPYAVKVTPTAAWNRVDVYGVHAGPFDRSVVVLELPMKGALRYVSPSSWVPADTRLVALGPPGGYFEYKMFYCDANETDFFIVQLAPDVVVEVQLNGCQESFGVWWIAVVVCGVLVLVLLFYYLLAPKRRDNSHAPKGPNRDVCVIFTDIQSSVLLWSEIRERMAGALDMHKSLIRKLIAKYKCYEVKTVGDSFMIVTADPVAGVQLALAIQEQLYYADWATDDIDAFYKKQCPCNLSKAEYRQVFVLVLALVSVCLSA